MDSQSVRTSGKSIKSSISKPKIKTVNSCKTIKKPLRKRTISSHLKVKSEGGDELSESNESASDFDDSSRGSKDSNRETTTGSHIIFRNVSLDLDGYPDILCNVSFEILPGQKVGIVGPKHSDLNAIPIAMYTTQFSHTGDIIIDGKPLCKIQITKDIFILHKDPVIHSDTVRDNLDPFRSYNDCEILDALEKVKMKSVIMEPGVKLDSPVNLQRLTPIQRQLFFLSETILKVPKIIIVKENEDVRELNQVNKLHEVIKNCFENTTVIFLSNNINTINFCEKIYYLLDGKILEEGNPETLLKDSSSKLSGLILNMSESKIRSENLKSFIFEGTSQDKNKKPFGKFTDLLDFSNLDIPVDLSSILSDDNSNEISTDDESLNLLFDQDELNKPITMSASVTDDDFPVETSRSRKTDIDKATASKRKMFKSILKRCNEPIVIGDRQDSDIFEDVTKSNPRWKDSDNLNNHESYIKSKLGLEICSLEDIRKYINDLNDNSNDVCQSTDKFSIIKAKSKLRSDVLKGRLIESDDLERSSSKSKPNAEYIFPKNKTNRSKKKDISGTIEVLSPKNSVDKAEYVEVSKVDEMDMIKSFKKMKSKFTIDGLHKGTANKTDANERKTLEKNLKDLHVPSSKKERGFNEKKTHKNKTSDKSVDEINILFNKSNSNNSDLKTLSISTIESDFSNSANSICDKPLKSIGKMFTNINVDTEVSANSSKQRRLLKNRALSEEIKKNLLPDPVKISFINDRKKSEKL